MKKLLKDSNVSSRNHRYFKHSPTQKLNLISSYPPIIKKERKHISALIAVTLIAAVLLTGFVLVKGYLQSTAIEVCNNSDVLRLHIIANSDSDDDQRIKLLVRDAVLDFERANANTDVISIADAEKVLLDDGEPLLNAIRTVLKQNNATYDAQIILGDFDFPDRTYGGKLYPAGTYRAVRILLGNAEGRNWWCVMFPPLCILETQEGQIDYSEPIRFESIIINTFNYIKLHIFGS